MVMVVLREITGFAGTRLSRRGCAKRGREGRRRMQLDVYGGGKNGKERLRGERERRERKDTGGRLCSMRAKRASAIWRRWREHGGVEAKGGWKREEGGITRTGHAGQRATRVAR